MDLCGNETVVGQILLSDYTWAPALGVGLECGATLPEAGFPEAECFVAPCDGIY